MDQVGQDQKGQAAIEPGPFKKEDIGKAQDNAGDGQGGDGGQVENPDPPALGAGGQVGRHKGQDYACQTDDQGNQEGPAQVGRGIHGKGPPDVVKGQPHVGRVLLDQGQKKKGPDGEDHCQADRQGGQIGHKVPAPVLFNLEGLADKGHGRPVTVEEVQDKGQEGRSQEDEADDAPLAKVQKADDILIHHHRQGFVLAPHHEGDPVIDDDQGKDGKEGGDQGPSKVGQGDGGPLPGLGNGQDVGRFIGGTVLIAEDIREHEEGQGKGIEDRTGHNPPKAIDIPGQLQPVGQDPVGAKEDHQTHPMGDGGDQHGQGKKEGEAFLKTNAAALDQPGQGQGQGQGNQGGDGADPKRV